MSDYLILSRPDGILDVATVAHGADAVSKTLQYKGSCLYFPLKGGEKGKVMLRLDSLEASESETEWFLKSLAGYLDADILNPDGERAFSDSEDNDLSFIDTLPPPEDEFLPIRLFFSITNLSHDDLSRKIAEFFTSNEYDVTMESDGFSIYLSFNSYLDVFYFPSDAKLTGEIDCNCGGAGVYAEVVEIAENLSEFLGGTVEFTENVSISYAFDKNFEKLRRDFYLPMKQQFAFAVNDNREGMQGMLGWPVDGFEPKYIPDTVITPLGRYDIETLFEEIKRFGFSYVCDHRFLSRNTPRDSADFYIKEGLFIIWSSSFGGKSRNFHITDYIAMNQCADCFENALASDKFAKFPKEIYKWLTACTKRSEMDYSSAADYDFHYPPGYLQDEISYGFGHYLRRFKLPGGLCREERVHGEDVFLFGDEKNGFRLECEISYGYNGKKEPHLGNNFAHGDASQIEVFDIGATSVVYFLDGGFEGGFFRAEAEIYILDELYRFAMASESYEDVLFFRDTVKGALNVEDWYDEVIREESIDPHAPGATFCANITMPPCQAFKRNFPSVPERFIKDEIDFYKNFPPIEGTHLSMRDNSDRATEIIEKIIDELIDGENENKDDA